jgi:hypothetical protein
VRQVISFSWGDGEVTVSGYDDPKEWIGPQLEAQTNLAREHMLFLDEHDGKVVPEDQTTGISRYRLLDARKDNSEIIEQTKAEYAISCERADDLRELEEAISSNDANGILTTLSKITKYNPKPTTEGASLSYDGDSGSGTHLSLSQGSSLLHLALWKNAKISLKTLLLFTRLFRNPKEDHGIWLRDCQNSQEGTIWDLAAWMSTLRYERGPPGFVCLREDTIHFVDELLAAPAKVVVLIPALGKDVLLHVLIFCYAVHQ